MIVILEPEKKLSLKVLFLIERENISICGNVESYFFEKMKLVKHFPDNLGVGTVVSEIIEENDVEAIVMIRNPKIVLDERLISRVEKSFVLLDVFKGRWALGAAGGMGLQNERYNAMYSSLSPALPIETQMRPIADAFLDLYIINASFVREVLASTKTRLNFSFELALIVNGYLKGFISVFLPTLSIGVNGNYLERNIGKFEAELITEFRGSLCDPFIKSLSGAITLSNNLPVQDNYTPTTCQLPKPNPFSLLSLARSIEDTQIEHCDSVSISIITRTQFKRLYLLKRMLTSISRARLDNVSLEVVLATDIKKEFWEEIFNELCESFVNLNLKIVQNTSSEHSRVGNLFAGIEYASNDYILILDDDDYLDVFAFKNIQQAFFKGARPVVIANSQVHREQWEESSSGFYILSQSKIEQNYSPTSWKKMFSGVNSVPICGIIMPRERILARMKQMEFKYDLSEDYILFLLFLTDPNLPEIFELPFTVAHISVRSEGDNTVTMTDRTKWTHDIAGFVHDLMTSNAASQGMWKNISKFSGSEKFIEQAAFDRLTLQLKDKNKQIAILERQIAALRSLQNNEQGI